MNCQEEFNHSVYTMKKELRKQHINSNHDNTTDSTSLNL